MMSGGGDAGRGGYYLPHGQGFIDSHGQLRKQLCHTSACFQ